MTTTFVTSTSTVNGVRLHTAAAGDGDPIVFVHGGFTDHQAWRLVAPALAITHRVVVYDRRGHSLSGRPAVAATRRVEEDDVIALLEALDLGPVHLVGSSYGASIVLATTARRPDLVRSAVAHEPPLIDAVVDPGLDAVRQAFEAIARALADGAGEAPVQRFVDDLILGPGWWEQLPEVTRTTMVANAVTIPDMLADPSWADLDASALDGSGVPILLTDGSASPAWLRTTTAAVAGLVPSAQRHTYEGAGHMPHLTHPDALVEAVRRFTAASAAA